MATCRICGTTFSISKCGCFYRTQDMTLYNGCTWCLTCDHRTWYLGIDLAKVEAEEENA